jgi:hypothetical protein
MSGSSGIGTDRVPRFAVSKNAPARSAKHFVEEAAEGGLNRGIGGMTEVHEGFRRGRSLVQPPGEGWIAFAVKEETRRMGPGEIGRRVEVLVLQQEEGQDAGPCIGGKDLSCRRVWVFENDAGRGEVGSEMRGEGGSGAVAVEDDVSRRDFAGVGEPGPGRIRIRFGEAFGGVRAGAAAKAPVIHGEDVEAEVVQGGQGRNGVGERSTRVVQIENGVGRIRRLRGGRNPPPVELRDAGFRDVEVNLVKSEAHGGWGRGESAGGMEEQLPLSLIEEQAERAVAADSGGAESRGESGEQPASADQRGWLRGCWGTSGECSSG